MRKLAGLTFSALPCLALVLPASPALAGDEPPGWGDAIAARVIAERCPGTLESRELALLNDFIAVDFQKSIDAGSHGPAWWADLRDKLEMSYVEKYTDPANCTEDARETAEELVEEVKDARD